MISINKPPLQIKKLLMSTTLIQVNFKEGKWSTYACPLPPYPTRYEVASYPTSGNVRCCIGTVTASKRWHPQMLWNAICFMIMDMNMADVISILAVAWYPKACYWNKKFLCFFSKKTLMHHIHSLDLHMSCYLLIPPL